MSVRDQLKLMRLTLEVNGRINVTGCAFQVVSEDVEHPRLRYSEYFVEEVRGVGSDRS